ncbi:hypothetical protein B0T24DRAFT_366713 [Lasiosphaeria ovina]|uniref:Uncharacterized protein n=1 Tax=Lasiosphaeria ovina TaxID=92902 RepID=A0AAE0JZ60_9PEZI|nr:hypothetical protein B0T24DRAFT_366713 [Lasiosphaeria ovina]
MPKEIYRSLRAQDDLSQHLSNVRDDAAPEQYGWRMEHFSGAPRMPPLPPPQLPLSERASEHTTHHRRRGQGTLVLLFLLAWPELGGELGMWWEDLMAAHNIKCLCKRYRGAGRVSGGRRGKGNATLGLTRRRVEALSGRTRMSVASSSREGPQGYFKEVSLSAKHHCRYSSAAWCSLSAGFADPAQFLRTNQRVYGMQEHISEPS